MNYRKLLDKALSVFNLSNNCKQVYIAAFEAGDMTAGKLIDKLKMDRSSVYLAIDQLKAAGLLEVDEAARPKVIKAIEPRKILGRLEGKLQKIENIFDETYSKLDQLDKAYRSTSSQPRIQSYSGREGLQQIMQDILAGADYELLLFTNPTAEKAVFSKAEHQSFIRKRQQNNLFIKVLATDDRFAQELKKEDKKNLRETRILTGQSPFKCEVYIYGDKVAMLSYSDQVIGFVVNSPDYAEFCRWQFNNLWRSLGE